MRILHTIEVSRSGPESYQVLRNFMSFIDDIMFKLKSSQNTSMQHPEFASFIKKLAGQKFLR
jgi:hypothetical protein